MIWEAFLTELEPKWSNEIQISYCCHPENGTKNPEFEMQYHTIWKKTSPNAQRKTWQKMFWWKANVLETFCRLQVFIHKTMQFFSWNFDILLHLVTENPFCKWKQKEYYILISYDLGACTQWVPSLSPTAWSGLRTKFLGGAQSKSHCRGSRLKIRGT